MPFVTGDPDMDEVEARLNKGEDIEDILGSWEDEATKAYWAARGDKGKKHEPPMDEVDEDYTQEPAPLKLP